MTAFMIFILIILTVFAQNIFSRYQIVFVGLCSTCVQNIIFKLIYIYHVSAQGVDERKINVHYYYYYQAPVACQAD